MRRAPSMAKGLPAPWCPLVWKSQKIKQGCASTLAGGNKLFKASLGQLEWIMCTIAATLYPMFSLENRNRYSKKFSAVSVIDVGVRPRDQAQGPHWTR